MEVNTGAGCGIETSTVSTSHDGLVPTEHLESTGCTSPRIHTLSVVFLAILIFLLVYILRAFHQISSDLYIVVKPQQKLTIRFYLFSSWLVGDAFAGFSAITSVHVQHGYIINNVILWGLYVEADAWSQSDINIFLPDLTHYDTVELFSVIEVFIWLRLT